MMSWRPLLSEPQRLLCDVIQCHDAARAAAAAQRLARLLGDERAWAWCTRNRVASIAGHYLCPPATPCWSATHSETAARIGAYMAELDVVADQFAQHGIGLIALKNAGIARGLHACRGCCPMGDLDVLVKRSDFRAAHQQLLAMGYKFTFRSSLESADFEVAERSGSAEYVKRLGNGEELWLELQWRPIAGRWIRPDQEPVADDLFSRAACIAGSRAMLLSPVDNLVQVSLHTAKHSYVRAPGFRLHTDVDRIVHYQDIDWDDFQRQVVRLRVRTATYFSLMLAAELLATPIPGEVLSALRPASWKERTLTLWLRKVGLFDPDKPKFRRVEYPFFTALLYDELSGLARSMFPAADWMRQQNPAAGHVSLPYQYVRRLWHLTLRRENS